MIQISNLVFTRDYFVEIEKDDSQTTIVIILPYFSSFYEPKRKVYIVDEYEEECKSSYIIPVNKNIMIKCNSYGYNYDYEHRSYFEGFYPMRTYTSPNKNMHFIFSEENEVSDYIIQNFYDFPIFVEKTEQEQIIKLEYYSTYFAFFGAENPFLFKSFYSYIEKYLKNIEGININNYKKLTQKNYRINSKYLPLFEFYNAYINQLNIQVNIYIKQLYGGSDIYECEVDANQKDLTFLTTPISNMKCKNKKSIFNLLFSFDGTKIVSGYIAPDSYFDIYVEINDDKNTNIDISPIKIEILDTNNSAKYLRKDVQYSINFELNHMVKLDPSFNAEVTLRNEKTNIHLNEQNPVNPVSGNGFTIK